MRPRAVPGLDDIEVDGRSVLVRVDFNVPLQAGQVTDDTRIRGAIPTINALRKRGAKLVLASHAGRPRGSRNNKFSLLPAGARLAELLDTDVVFSHETVGDGVVRLIKDQPDDAVLLVENLRFDPREKGGAKDFAKLLASLADVYVNDAFGTMHRTHASITGVPEFLPSAAGLLVKKELAALGPLLSGPRDSFGAILGGAKVSDKIGVIDALSKRTRHLFLGGAMAYTFLAARGIGVGRSRVDQENIGLADALLQRCKDRGVEVHLPTDHVAASAFEEGAEALIVDALDNDLIGLDIGPRTLEAWRGPLVAC